MDAVALIARLALAAILLVAAAGKTLDQPGTRETLRAFGLGGRMARTGAPALVAAEALTVLALLIVSTARAGAAAAIVLFIVFSAALVRAQRGAEEAPPCHCFGQIGDRPAGPEALVRNAGFTALAIIVVVVGHGASVPPWVPALVALLAVVAAVVVWFRRPGALGRLAPAWDLPAQDGGPRLSLADLAGHDAVLLFTGADCPPCHALLGDLSHWDFEAAPPVVVLAAGEAPAVEGARVLSADTQLREAYGVTATPGAVRIDARGRVNSAPALGALAIETLARGSRPLTGFAGSAFDVGFEVQADDPDLVAGARSVLPPGTSISDQASTDARWTLLTRGARIVLYRDNVLVGRTDTEAAALETLAAGLRLHVAELAPDRAFVHAGVVALDGHAIVVPGRSFTGKSTLVTALLRAGATYFSDEYAVIDADGLVHPYIKPIALRPAGTYVSREHPVSEFSALEPASAPVPVGAIVVAPFEAGATWEPGPQSSGAGAMALIGNAVGVRRDPQRVMGALRAAAEDAVVLEGPRGEADETAAALLAHLRDLRSELSRS